MIHWSIGVDPKFLDTTFVEFSVSKGSNTVPDVAAVLERALTDKSMQQPLDGCSLLEVSESTWEATLDGTITT